MKKSKMLAAAMASIALTGTMHGCGFQPSENDEPDVYGPPMPYEEHEIVEEEIDAPDECPTADGEGQA